MKTNPHRPTESPAYSVSGKSELSASHAYWLQLFTLLLALCSYGISSNLSAANSLASTDSVFRFQSKMAQRGHVASQYALAYMYESGQGTEKDLAQASEWYHKAAQQGFAPAKDRLVYIDILNNGFQAQQQRQWLLALKQNADDYNYKHQGESAFLLAQLYAAGLAVNKSLTMAIKYLHLAEAANVIGSDSEIRRVEAELDALRATYMPTASDTSQGTGKPPVDSKASAVKKQQTNSNPVQTSLDKKTAGHNSNAAAKPVFPAESRASSRPMNQPRVVDKHKVTASSPVTKKTPSATPPIRQKALPAAEQSSRAEKDEPHPMQIICSGWQRLDSACR